MVLLEVFARYKPAGGSALSIVKDHWRPRTVTVPVTPSAATMPTSWSPALERSASRPAVSVPVSQASTLRPSQTYAAALSPFTAIARVASLPVVRPV